MKKIKIKGKSVEEAKGHGLKILGLKEEDVDLAIITEGKPGVLGMFGGEECEVEIRQKISAAADAKEILQEILNRLALVAVAEIVSEEENSVALDVKGEDLGKIIGKDGAMLSSLQLIVSSIISRDFSRKIYVNIDAGGYRSNHEQALCRLAKEAAKDVASSGIEKALPPMSAADRRIIHMALKEEEGVTTYSEGEREGRRLIITPNK